MGQVKMTAMFSRFVNGGVDLDYDWLISGAD